MRIMKILGLSLATLSIATMATAPVSARHRHQVCHMEHHHGHNVKVCHWAH
jgi:hypothetical protein